MQVSISGHHLDVTPALREYVEDTIHDIGDEPTNIFVLDLYQHALDMVDWYELAGHVLTQYASQTSTSQEETA